jgi:hypothetical protein
LSIVLINWKVNAQSIVCLYLIIYATIGHKAYIPLRKAVEFLELHPHTLRKYADEGLQALLVRFMRGEQLTVVVACRDRLCRFGFELFEFMAQQNGGKIVVLDRTAVFTTQF